MARNIFCVVLHTICIFHISNKVIYMASVLFCLSVLFSKYWCVQCMMACFMCHCPSRNVVPADIGVVPRVQQIGPSPHVLTGWTCGCGYGAATLTHTVSECLFVWANIWVHAPLMAHALDWLPAAIYCSVAVFCKFLYIYIFKQPAAAAAAVWKLFLQQ